MPSCSWSGIGRSCSAEYQPGRGTDIELCVAASATSGSARPQSSTWPLQGPAAGAAVVVPPDATNVPIAAAMTTTATTGATSRRGRLTCVGRASAGCGARGL
jgi:hypothetical protein